MFIKEATLQGEPTMAWAGEELSSPLTGGMVSLKVQVAAGFWKEGRNPAFTLSAWNPGLQVEPHEHLAGQDSQIFFDDATPFPVSIVWML